MNLTLAVEERIVEGARKTALAMGKSLNQVLRERLEELAGLTTAETDIAEVESLSRSSRGRSRGWKFDRQEIHDRP